MTDDELHAIRQRATGMAMWESDGDERLSQRTAECLSDAREDIPRLLDEVASLKRQIHSLRMAPEQP